MIVTDMLLAARIKENAQARDSGLHRPRKCAARAELLRSSLQVFGVVRIHKAWRLGVAFKKGERDTPGRGIA